MDKAGLAEGGQDDELSVPRAALNKMIKELIPRIRVANDARELILNCCTEFIHLVSSEANDICVKQQKKTISPDHVLEGSFVDCQPGSCVVGFTASVCVNVHVSEFEMPSDSVPDVLILTSVYFYTVTHDTAARQFYCLSAPDT